MAAATQNGSKFLNANRRDEIYGHGSEEFCPISEGIVNFLPSVFCFGWFELCFRTVPWCLVFGWRTETKSQSLVFAVSLSFSTLQIDVKGFYLFDNFEHNFNFHP